MRLPPWTVPGFSLIPPPYLLHGIATGRTVHNLCSEAKTFPQSTVGVSRAPFCGRLRPFVDRMLDYEIRLKPKPDMGFRSPLRVGIGLPPNACPFIDRTPPERKARQSVAKKSLNLWITAGSRLTILYNSGVFPSQNRQFIVDSVDEPAQEP